MTEATEKQTFTVERAYLCPIYAHIQVEATTAEEAARLAMDDTAYPWDNDKVDYESARATYIDGIWQGPAYGEGGTDASLPIPPDLTNPETRPALDAQQLADQIRGILNVGTGDKERDDALALAKTQDIRRLIDNLETAHGGGEISAAELRALHIEHAAAHVIYQRDYFAEHGVYNDGMTRPDGDQCFDDWAADLLQQALRRDGAAVALKAVADIRQFIAEPCGSPGSSWSPEPSIAEAVEALHARMRSTLQGGAIQTKRHGLLRIVADDVLSLAALVEALARKVGA